MCQCKWAGHKLAGPDAQGTDTASLSFSEPQETMRVEEGIPRQLGKEKASAGLFPRVLGSWALLHLICGILDYFIGYKDFPLYWAVEMTP